MTGVNYSFDLGLINHPLTNSGKRFHCLALPHSLATLHTGHNFISISTTSFDKYEIVEVIRKEESGSAILKYTFRRRGTSDHGLEHALAKFDLMIFYLITLRTEQGSQIIPRQPNYTDRPIMVQIKSILGSADFKGIACFRHPGKLPDSPRQESNSLVTPLRRPKTKHTVEVWNAPLMSWTRLEESPSKVSLLTWMGTNPYLRSLRT